MKKSIAILLTVLSGALVGLADTNEVPALGTNSGLSALRTQELESMAAKQFEPHETHYTVVPAPVRLEPSLAPQSVEAPKLPATSARLTQPPMEPHPELWSTRTPAQDGLYQPAAQLPPTPLLYPPTYPYIYQQAPQSQFYGGIGLDYVRPYREPWHTYGWFNYNHQQNFVRAPHDRAPQSRRVFQPREQHNFQPPAHRAPVSGPPSHVFAVPAPPGSKGPPRP